MRRSLRSLSSRMLVGAGLVGVLGTGSWQPASAQAANPRAVLTELGLEESATPARELPGWRAPKKIAVLAFAADHIAELRAAAPGVEFIVIKGRDDFALAKDADVIIGACPPELVAAAPQVRWIQHFSAGVEQCLTIPSLRERKVLLTNMQRVRSAPIAEHGLGMLLLLSRRLDLYYREQEQGRWTRSPGDRGIQELNGKTALVVGLGGIGTEFARLAHGIGMRVTATRNSDRPGPEFVSYVGKPDELLKLAREADVVFNAAPLTPATTGLFNAAFFAVLKPTAFFINVARGKSVVTADLVDALKSKRLAGAGLDVTDPEPLPAGHPLWTAPNVIITPHVASDSDRPDDKVVTVLLENLRRYVAGDKMLAVVDLNRGY